MSNQDSLQVIRDYFNGHDIAYFAEDGELHDMSQPQPLRGHAAISAFLNLLYHEAFSEAHAELRDLIGGDGAVVAEFVFHGKNTGSLAGAPPAGKTVAVPMIVAYELNAGKIQRARLYYDTATLAKQLGWTS